VPLARLDFPVPGHFGGYSACFHDFLSFKYTLWDTIPLQYSNTGLRKCQGSNSHRVIGDRLTGSSNSIWASKFAHEIQASDQLVNKIPIPRRIPITECCIQTPKRTVSGHPILLPCHGLLGLTVPSKPWGYNARLGCGKEWVTVRRMYNVHNRIQTNITPIYGNCQDPDRSVGGQ